MTAVILVDGKRTEFVNALDRGLAYGDGIFRTMLARAGRVRFWRRHYRKLVTDCGRIGIVCPQVEILDADLRKILRVAPDCVVKIIITRGQGGRGYAPPQDPVATRLVASFPAPEPRLGSAEQGIRVRWCDTRLAMQPALAGVKHLSRLENVLARGEWSDPDIAEGLMLDQPGNVIEGTASNLFVLEKDRLVTPSLSDCGVAGVQRDRVMDIARDLDLACSVDVLSPQRVWEADQVILVNSVIGLWWVSALEERRWQRCDRTAAIARLLDEGDD